MRNKLIIFLTAGIFITITANSQIEKGNWMVGGSAYFTSAHYINTTAATYTQTELQISPNVGYFFVNKFAAGLKPGYSYTSTTLGTGNNSIHTFNIGPFVRYYFLNTESRVNIFSEINYQYNISKMDDNQSSSYNAYSILAGPVVYFNSSVGIEFSVGYSAFKINGDFASKNRTVQIGIGLQVYLQTEKNYNKHH